MMERDDPRIIAVQGYCELGMFSEAWRELGSLTEEHGDDPQILLVKLRVLMLEKRWSEAADTALALSREQPDSTAAYLHGAFCLHEDGRTEEARDRLHSGPGSLLKEPVYHYNMACYLSVLDELEDARAYLQRALEMDNALEEAARADPDLTSLADLF